MQLHSHSRCICVGSSTRSPGGHWGCCAGCTPCCRSQGMGWQLEGTVTASGGKAHIFAMEPDSSWGKSIFGVDGGKMCKWHEFASSDPMQPMQCSARLQSSRESPLGQQENETSSASFGGHTGFCASMDIRATTASCTTQPQFLPLLLKPLQKSQWETLLGCDRSWENNPACFGQAGRSCCWRGCSGQAEWGNTYEINLFCGFT